MHRIYTENLTAWKSDFAVLDPNTKTSYTFDEYYNEMIGNFGTRGSVWQTIVDNQEKEVQQDEEKASADSRCINGRRTCKPFDIPARIQCSVEIYKCSKSDA